MTDNLPTLEQRMWDFTARRHHERAVAAVRNAQESISWVLRDLERFDPTSVPDGRARSVTTTDLRNVIADLVDAARRISILDTLVELAPVYRPSSDGGAR